MTPPIKNIIKPWFTRVQSGCNVIDSAINYRLQRSERSIGTALKDLAAKGYNRDEIVVATKGGFIPYDGTPPKDARAYIEQTFIKPGLAAASDIVSGCHCMTPKYLLNQLDCSLRNLDVESIDIYYLHNPETQLGKITQDEFDGRLVKAFEALEGAVSAGKIRMYGMATWNCFRNEADAKDYLSLAHVMDISRKSRRQAASLQSHSIAAQSRHERSACRTQISRCTAISIPCSKPRKNLASPSCAARRCCKGNSRTICRRSFTKLSPGSKPTASAHCNLSAQRQA